MKNNVRIGLSDFVKNFSPIRSDTERIQLMLNSAFHGLRDPNDGSHISRLTDLTSMNTLRWIKMKMEESEEGKRILTDKPRVSTESVNFEKLKNFDKNTLGFLYFQYMSNNYFSPDNRPVVEFIPDLELAYICQRYKETHDFYHVIFNLGRTVRDEVALKWFEALHLRLPSSSIAGLFGSLRLSPSEIIFLYSNLLPNVVENSKNSKFVMSVYFENRLEQNIDDLRNELKIKPFNFLH
jgi:ubiquinone biosynthesis protein COQ4